MKILLLTKSTPWCHLVQEVLRKSEHDVTVVEGVPMNAKVSLFPGGEWDLIISYLCPWVLHERLLKSAPRAINFHPAPPWHPGFAPYSWAIYDLDTFEPYDGLPSYGYTIHEMSSAVDSGRILSWNTIPMNITDSVYRLQCRTMKRLFQAFVEFVQNGFKESQRVNIKWSGRPKTREDFEALRRIPANAPVYDIEARIRACRYPGQPGAYFEGEPQ